MRKRFDRKLYEENDRLAKENTIKIFNKLRKKFVIEENTKKTCVDLKVFHKEEHKFNVECEIKRVWKEDEFPYDSVQFPKRKTKFAKLDKPTLFIMFNKDLTSYCAVTSGDLLSSPVKEVPNRYVYQGEEFFQVNLENAHFNNLNKAIKKLEEQTNGK